MAGDQATQALFDIWKKQIEEGTQAWARLLGQAQATGQAADPAQFWRPFMDQGMAAWSKLLSQGPVSPDLMGQWKQFVDEWIAAWGKALEQAMGTEIFAQALGKQLEQWLAVQGPMKKAADEAAETTLATLGIPSRKQVIGLARQVTDLDDRLEAIEDRLGELTARLGSLLKTREERGKGGGARAGKKG